MVLESEVFRPVPFRFGADFAPPGESKFSRSLGLGAAVACGAKFNIERKNELRTVVRSEVIGFV